jgi:hypothetical protein
MNLTITPNLLVAIVAVILAVLFDWLPGLKTWYDKFTDGQKRGIMALLLLITTAAVLGISCAAWWPLGITCNAEGIRSAIYMLVLAIAINQGTHILTKPTDPTLPQS